MRFCYPCQPYWRFGAQRGATGACEPRTARPGGADSALPQTWSAHALDQTDQIAIWIGELRQRN